MNRTVLLLASLILSFILGVAASANTVQTLRWDRLPLAVALIVGEERVIFVDHAVRIGVPDALGERLRVQTAGGAVYLTAEAPIETTRLQLQDAQTGALILLDITAEPGASGHVPLPPLRIIDRDAAEAAQPISDTPHGDDATPLPVVLTRYAAQSLYAPIRVIEPVPGIAPLPLRPHQALPLQTLLPTLPVRARARAAWRLRDHWVTAVLLTNTADRWLSLDPRALQGDFLAASFQHPDLGPAGRSTDNTVLYLVTRGHGLADALLPAISPVDASIHLPLPSMRERP